MAWRLVREVLRQLLSIVARRMAYMVESADAPEAAVADALTDSRQDDECPSSPTAGTSAFSSGTTSRPQQARRPHALRRRAARVARMAARCACRCAGLAANAAAASAAARWAAGLEQQWNGQWRLGVENRLVSGSPLVRGPWPGRFRRWRP